MGADIHLAFETQQDDGTWALTFPLRPSEWWYDRIIDKKAANGALALVFADDGQTRPRFNATGTDDEQKAELAVYEAAMNYFKAIPEEEVIDRYGRDPDIQWDFYAAMPESQPYGPVVRSRCYTFFAMIAGVRAPRTTGNDVLFQPRGMPHDLTPEFRRDVEQWGDDAHTCSWIGVSELIDNPVVDAFAQTEFENDLTEHRRSTRKLPGYFTAIPTPTRGSIQVRLDWLRAHIPDPTRTRMVFFFDN